MFYGVCFFQVGGKVCLMGISDQSQQLFQSYRSGTSGLKHLVQGYNTAICINWPLEMEKLK